MAPAHRTNPSAPIPSTEAIAFSCVVADQPSMIGSRIPLTMKLVKECYDWLIDDLSG